MDPCAILPLTHEPLSPLSPLSPLVPSYQPTAHRSVAGGPGSAPLGRTRTHRLTASVLPGFVPASPLLASPSIGFGHGPLGVSSPVLAPPTAGLTHVAEAKLAARDTSVRQGQVGLDSAPKLRVHRRGSHVLSSGKATTGPASIVLAPSGSIDLTLYKPDHAEDPSTLALGPQPFALDDVDIAVAELPGVGPSPTMAGLRRVFGTRTGDAGEDGQFDDAVGLGLLAPSVASVPTQRGDSGFGASPLGASSASPPAGPHAPIKQEGTIPPAQPHRDQYQRRHRRSGRFVPIPAAVGPITSAEPTVPAVPAGLGLGFFGLGIELEGEPSLAGMPAAFETPELTALEADTRILTATKRISPRSVGKLGKLKASAGQVEAVVAPVVTVSSPASLAGELAGNLDPSETHSPPDVFYPAELFHDDLSDIGLGLGIDVGSSGAWQGALATPASAPFGEVKDRHQLPGAFPDPASPTLSPTTPSTPSLGLPTFIAQAATPSPKRAEVVAVAVPSPRKAKKTGGEVQAQGGPVQKRAGRKAAGNSKRVGGKRVYPVSPALGESGEPGKELKLAGMVSLILEREPLAAPGAPTLVPWTSPLGAVHAHDHLHDTPKLAGTPDLGLLPGAFLASPVLPTSIADFAPSGSPSSAARLPVPLAGEVRKRFTKVRRAQAQMQTNPVIVPPSSVLITAASSVSVSTRSSALTVSSPALNVASPSSTPILSPILSFTSAYDAPDAQAQAQASPIPTAAPFAATTSAPAGGHTDAALFDVAITSTIVGAVVCLSALGWIVYRVCTRRGPTVAVARSASTASSSNSAEKPAHRRVASGNLRAPSQARLSLAMRGPGMYPHVLGGGQRVGSCESGLEHWIDAAEQPGRLYDATEDHGGYPDMVMRADGVRDVNRRASVLSRHSAVSMSTAGAYHDRRSLHRASVASSFAESAWSTTAGDRTMATSRTSYHSGGGGPTGSSARSIVSAAPPRLPNPVASGSSAVSVRYSAESGVFATPPESPAAGARLVSQADRAPPVPSLPLDYRAFAPPHPPLLNEVRARSRSNSRASRATKVTATIAINTAEVGGTSEDPGRKKERRRATLDGGALETAQVQTLLFQQQLDVAAAALAAVSTGAGGVRASQRDSRDSAGLPELYKDDPFFRAEARLTSRHSLVGRPAGARERKASAGGAASEGGGGKKKPSRRQTMPSNVGAPAPAIVVSDHPKALVPPKSPARARSASASASSGVPAVPPLPAGMNSTGKQAHTDDRLSVKTSSTGLPWLQSSSSHGSSLSSCAAGDDVSVMDPDLRAHRHRSADSARFSYYAANAGKDRRQVDEVDLGAHRLSMTSTYSAAAESSEARDGVAAAYACLNGLASSPEKGSGTDSDGYSVDLRTGKSKRVSLVDLFPLPPQSSAACSALTTIAASPEPKKARAHDDEDLGLASRLAELELDFDVERIDALVGGVLLGVQAQGVGAGEVSGVPERAVSPGGGRGGVLAARYNKLAPATPASHVVPPPSTPSPAAVLPASTGTAGSSLPVRPPRAAARTSGAWLASPLSGAGSPSPLVSSAGSTPAFVSRSLRPSAPASSPNTLASTVPSTPATSVASSPSPSPSTAPARNHLPLVAGGGATRPAISSHASTQATPAAPSAGAPTRSFAADLQDSVGIAPTGYDSDTLLNGGGFAAGRATISALFAPAPAPAPSASPYVHLAVQSNLYGYDSLISNSSSESLAEHAAVACRPSGGGAGRGRGRSGTVSGGRLPNGRRLWQSSEGEESGSAYEESDFETTATLRRRAAEAKAGAGGGAGGAAGGVAEAK